jgi:hypothetical protein
MVFIPSICSRITWRVSSRIWCGEMWCVCHLRADSVVWLSHTSSVWPWSGMPKVRLYGTFLGGLHQKSNTFVWVMDGSYDWKKAADLSGVSWIIFWSKTGLQLTSTFWERSPAARSYWAEMLGLSALHLFARALSEFHKIQEWRATLCCNNKRAFELSSYARRRIRPSAKCTDI